MIDKFVKGKESSFYVIFRVLVGLLFMQRGVMKFGNWDGLTPLLQTAGVIELVAGALVLVGLFVRLSALISAVEMLVAYAMAHVPTNWLLGSNNGEAALMFFAAFLVMIAYGAGKLSLGKAIFKKEVC